MNTDFNRRNKINIAATFILIIGSIIGWQFNHLLAQTRSETDAQVTQQSIFTDSDRCELTGRLESKVTLIRNCPALQNELIGGWTIGQGLFIGLGYSWLTTPMEGSPTAVAAYGKSVFYTMNYAGPLIEINNNPNDLVHQIIGLQFGLGSAGYLNTNGAFETPADIFYFAEPRVGMEWNLLPGVQINAGLSYFWVHGVYILSGISDDLISSWGLRVGCRVDCL